MCRQIGVRNCPLGQFHLNNLIFKNVASCLWEFGNIFSSDSFVKWRNNAFYIAVWGMLFLTKEEPLSVIASSIGEWYTIADCSSWSNAYVRTTSLFVNIRRYRFWPHPCHGNEHQQPFALSAGSDKLIKVARKHCKSIHVLLFLVQGRYGMQRVHLTVD